MTGQRPPESQPYPGSTGDMTTQPRDCMAGWRASGLLFGRAAEPDEIAPSYLFFASGAMSSYFSGEVLAPIGGETLPG